MQTLTTAQLTIAYQCIDDALRNGIATLEEERATLRGHAKGLITKKINQCRTAQMISESMQDQLDMPSINTAETYAQQLEWATMQAEKALGYDGCFLRSTIQEAIAASEQTSTMTNEQFNTATAAGFAAVRKQMGAKIEAIQAYHASLGRGWCIDFNVFQPAVENAYACEPEQFDNDAIEPDSLQTAIWGAESTIDSFYDDVLEVQQPVQQAVQDRQAVRTEYGLIVERLHELATHDSCIENEYCSTATVVHIVAEYIQGKVQPCIVQYCAIEDTFLTLQEVLACAMLHDTWLEFKHVPLDADLLTYLMP